MNSCQLQAQSYWFHSNDRHLSTSPSHCGAAGHSSLQCSRSAGSGGQESSRWWGADKLVWSETSSPPPLCSKSWALSGAQTAAGLQEHPHHTHKYKQKIPTAETNACTKSGVVHVCGGGGEYRKVGEVQWGGWGERGRVWQCENEETNTK